jgi:energy-coupling factor transporter ATP-binding protein EcfA2
MTVKIEGIKILIRTHQGNTWGRTLSFLNADGKANEVNLIYGENELGKSTLLNCMIYCLGGEDVYGGVGAGSKLSVALTKVIGNNEFIAFSTIFLQLNDGKERIVIERNALSADDPIFVYKNTEIGAIKTETPLIILKSKKDKNIDGNQTFNDFLMKYFGMPEYKSKDLKDSERKIYFQNFLPLFFVHQHAWVDIQTTNPFYGISDVKKLVFQLIMNLSEVNNIADRLLLQSLKSELREKEQSKELMNDIVGSTEFHESKKIADRISNLRSDTAILNKQLLAIQADHTTYAESYDTDKEEYLKIRKLIEEAEDNLLTIDKEIDQYTYYLNKINLDIEKTDILKTAKKLISGLPISKCPHCYHSITVDAESESTTGGCSLCGNPMVFSNSSDNDQLLEYLKDERKDFLTLKADKETKKKAIEGSLFLWRINIKEIKNKIDKSQMQLTPKFMREHFKIANKIGSIDSMISNLEKDRKIIEAYENLIISINNLNIRIKLISKTLREAENAGEDEMKIQHFESKFKEYLKEIDFLKYENVKSEQKQEEVEGQPEVNPVTLRYFALLKIDRTDFKPKIENENIYNLTSASGLVRIINAYYLALLETCMHFSSKTFHPGILLLDEPRQQNLDLGSYKKLTKLYSDLRTKYANKYQIIFTSGNRGSLKTEEIHLDLGKDTYLLEKLN